MNSSGLFLSKDAVSSVWWLGWMYEDGSVVLDGSLRRETTSTVTGTTFQDAPRLLLLRTCDVPPLLTQRCAVCCYCCCVSGAAAGLHFGPCVFSLVYHQRDGRALNTPRLPPPLWAGRRPLRRVFCSLPRQPSPPAWPKKYGPKYLSFLKRGIFVFMKQQLSKFLQCFSVVQSFFFSQKRTTQPNFFLDFFACGSKIKQSACFSSHKLFVQKGKKKKSPCSILQTVTPIIG